MIDKAHEAEPKLADGKDLAGRQVHRGDRSMHGCRLFVGSAGHGAWPSIEKQSS
jgi:hypothetical protein